MTSSQILRIGDSVDSLWGRTEIERITLRGAMSIDPKGEDPDYSPQVKGVEVSPDWVGAPFIVDLANGHFAYSHQISPIPDDE